MNLRGLRASRNLILINGRRVSPSGVEGAPAAPNLNLLPRSLVARYDILLDGASSVYGSDAIAGVVNAVLKKDFAGLELEIYSNHPEQKGGADSTVYGSWGVNTDRGYSESRLSMRSLKSTLWGIGHGLPGCETHMEVDENGRLRTEGQYFSSVGYDPLGNCRLGSLGARTFIPDLAVGSIYYTPEYSNGGWGNFSESGDPFTGLAADGNGDVEGDVDLRRYDLNGKPSQLDADLFRNLHGLTSWLSENIRSLERLISHALL